MKKEKGITLIALVITIIVLLILAGVTIVTLTGDNGILQQADKAKMLTEIGEIEENVKLKTLENENQQLIEGSLDSIGLNISENLINKYKDIVYVKDSKLYLSFIANFPQTDSYINNKDKIEVLKNNLEINYESIKTYNKVINPSFDDGINGYSITYNGVGIETEILSENNNYYLHTILLDRGKTGYVDTIVHANEYNDKIYTNIKYRNNYNSSNENNKINTAIIRTKTSKGFANLLLNSDNFINSYNSGWQSVSDIRTVYEKYETLVTTLRVGGNEAQNSSQDYAIDIDDVYMINLTEIFGAENEPTKAQMDEMFNNF